MSPPGRRRARARRRGVFQPVVAGSVALLAALLGACADQPAGSADAPSIFDGGADQVMFGVEHYLTRDGLRRARLTADTAFTYDEEARIELRLLELEFHGDDGESRGVLTAPSGEYALDSGGMTVRGGVSLDGRLQGDGRSTLTTDSLVYDPVAEELRTDASWTMRHADGTVERGNGLVTDPALENIRASDWRVTTPDVVVPQ